MSYGGFLTAGVVTLGVVSSAEGAFRRKSPPHRIRPLRMALLFLLVFVLRQADCQGGTLHEALRRKKTIVEYGDRKKINKQKKGIYFFARCLKSCRKPVNTM